MSPEGAHRAAGLTLASLALWAAYRRRELRPVAAYVVGFAACEVLRAYVPRGTGARGWVILQHALYLAPRTLGALYALGAVTGLRWPLWAGCALLGGSLATLAALYPLGPERLSMAWTLIEGLAVGAGLAALAWHYARPPRRGFGGAPLGLMTVAVGGDFARWATAYLGHARRLVDGWPTVRALGIVSMVVCAVIFAVSGLRSSSSRWPSH